MNIKENAFRYRAMKQDFSHLTVVLLTACSIIAIAEGQNGESLVNICVYVFDVKNSTIRCMFYDSRFA